MGQSPEIRVLKDALFSYASGQAGCGWHVDDLGFWPASNESAGITIWIALDDMKVTEGGGLSVANGTHNRKEEWVNECIQSIRGGDTCGMENNFPTCHSKLNSIKLQWDLQAGDAIVWNRWA